MSALPTFDNIYYEIEHPYFLAHIHRAYTGIDHITRNGSRIKAKEIPNAVEHMIRGDSSTYKISSVYTIYVKWTPKYEYIQSPIHDAEMTAYRALYPFYFHVGDHYASDEVDDLIEEAKDYAENISDPADWRELGYKN